MIIRPLHGNATLVVRRLPSERMSTRMKTDPEGEDTLRPKRSYQYVAIASASTKPAAISLPPLSG